MLTLIIPIATVTKAASSISKKSTKPWPFTGNCKRRQRKTRVNGVGDQPRRFYGRTAFWKTCGESQKKKIQNSLPCVQARSSSLWWKAALWPLYRHPQGSFLRGCPTTTQQDEETKKTQIFPRQWTDVFRGPKSIAVATTKTNTLDLRQKETD
mgnify:CR=1 FL=1